MGFLAALGFLTILPIPKRAKLQPAGSLPYFPLVGFILGLLLAGLSYGLGQLLPEGVTAALLVIFLAVITGGHHLDGLADTFGGLRGKSREARLGLMAETGASAAGVAAVSLLLLAKYLALRQAAVIPSLVLAPTLARSTVLSAIFVFPPARIAGMGYTFKQGLGWRGLTAATLLPLLAAIIVAGLNGLILGAVLYIVTFGFGYYLYRKLGGLTGDTYGALIETGEALAFILFILL